MPDSTSTPAIRELPYNEEAEQGLLGALLVDNRLLDRIADVIRPEDFYIPVHGRIFAAIRRLRDQGQVASPVTLKALFAEDEELSHAGGAAYLAELAAQYVSVVNIDDYAQVVQETALRRELISIGETLVNDAYRHDLDNPAEKQVEVAENSLFQLAEARQTSTGFQPLNVTVGRAVELAERAANRDSKLAGVTTGLDTLDRKLGGLQKSDLLILAGRPGMGKTALATNIAYCAAKAYQESRGREGAVVGFFSLEMAADQLAGRVLADISGVPTDRMRKGEVSDRDFVEIAKASQRMADVPLFIDDTPALSIAAVRSRARRLARQHKMGMLVVDYLQLLQGATRTDNRVQELSEITRGLKAIAKELQIPVLALSQLSRQVEQREDKRPQLADLRESGSIEQDADAVMFVFREEYYLREPQRREGEEEDRFQDRYARFTERQAAVHNTAEVILAKHRHGPTGTVKLYFDSALTRFADLEDRFDDDSGY